MTSTQIRQSFLDFFQSKQHTIVPSSSLLPDSPNLLFTNAGMNQFVPIFLGQVKCPYTPGRAADTQKCIRAGGKHNDLEDVGLDTYHHTFFEMLGNWSFGDYFKKEAIEWAWELVIGTWKFPPERLYATVYSPDQTKGDPSEFDQEAYDHWARFFAAAGLDPKVHIVSGGKKDNFWMMGDTGPCGPCSELHVDLTPNGDTKGALVNQGSAQCIEIWNLVFMQFNANPDGTFSPLPAKSVDTGMGFERVTGIIQNTKGFTDFSRVISNYETDIFRPIFDKLEKLSGKKYASTLPNTVGSTGDSPVPVGDPPTGTGGTSASQANAGLLKEALPASAGLVARQDGQVARATQEQIATDIAFRVIADHIRTLSFAIADGIQPGNTDRNYVLRRILRRAVRYGRTLGFHEPFFYKLVDVLADTMGDVFPEIRAKQKHVQDVIRTEEEAFNKTLDRGLEMFDNVINRWMLAKSKVRQCREDLVQASSDASKLPDQKRPYSKLAEQLRDTWSGFFASIVGITGSTLSDHTGASRWALAEPNFQLGSTVATFGDLVFRGTDPEGSEGAYQSLLAEHQGALDDALRKLAEFESAPLRITGAAAFALYDTYGFPLDLTELMARERGLTVDVAGFEKLMDEQKARARAAQKKTVIELSQVETQTPTEFVGFDQLETPAKVLEVVSLKDKTAIILDTSACYAEMGGQVGDTGKLEHGAQFWRVTNTQKSGNTYLHFLEEGSAGVPPAPGGVSPTGSAARDAQPSDRDGRAPQAHVALPVPGSEVRLSVNRARRAAIQRHHTVTHLLHWALHEVVNKEASQKGSFVGPDKLTFDFNSAPLTPQQVADVERLVNERILENAPVSWIEVEYNQVKIRDDIMQFFGEKYGDWVRVVQIGGQPTGLDGYSMELCGGTHTRATGEIGLFRIVSETAIAAGVRRIEAVAGLEAWRRAGEELALLKTVSGRLATPIPDLDKKIENVLAQQKDLEKQLRAIQQKEAAAQARSLLGKAATVNGIPALIERLDADGDTLQGIVNDLKGQFKGVILLGGVVEGAVALVAAVSPEFTATVQAGKLIQQIAPIVGGKGGGRPDNARGGGKLVDQLGAALAKARSLLG